MSGANIVGWMVALILLGFMFGTDSSPRIDCAIGVKAACEQLAGKY